MKDAFEVKCGPSVTVTSGPNNPIVEYEGSFAETDIPQMTCTREYGTGTCEITNETNGGPSTNVLPTPCEQTCMQIAIDNTGGPNQGTIYVSSNNSLTQCCPRAPAERGGINVFAPSGEHIKTIYTKSQFEFNVRSCGVAVAPNGDLIVAHGEGNTAFNYIDHLAVQPWATHPEQEPPVVGTINSSVLSNCKTAVDSMGTVYTQGGTSDTSTGQARKFPASAFGEPVGEGFRIPPNSSIRTRWSILSPVPISSSMPKTSSTRFGVTRRSGSASSTQRAR